MREGQSLGQSAGATCATSLLCSWHEADPRPALIVDSDRNILWLNAAARQYLEDSRTFGLRGIILHATDGKQDGILTQHLIAATPAPSCCMIADERGAH